MKKLIALCLVCLMSFSMIASAESINIANLTHDELLSLHKQITLELFGEALISGIELPSGEYEGGVDIPIGSYVISVCGEKARVHISVYEGLQREQHLYYHQGSSNDFIPDAVKVTIKEGQYLVVTDRTDSKITIAPWATYLIN